MIRPAQASAGMPRGTNVTKGPIGRWPSQAMASVHALTLALIAFAAMGVNLGGSVALPIASVCILLFGLPHGALDVAVIRRVGRSDGGLAVILVVYIGVAAAMAVLWWTASTLALAVFLVIAVVHFAEDWAETGSTFMATGVALALVAAPTLFHRANVAEIFVALTGTTDASVLAEFLLIAAPVGLVVAAAGMLALIEARRFDTVAAAATSLAAFIALPPAIGFAVFFCLFHSPRHFTDALRALGMTRAEQWLPIAVPTMLGALGLVAALYEEMRHVSVAVGLMSATFIALSILTVPHMVVPSLVAAFARRLNAPLKFS